MTPAPPTAPHKHTTSSPPSRSKTARLKDRVIGGALYAYREMGFTLAIIFFSLGTLAFLSIAEEVNEGEYQAVDNGIISSLRVQGDLSRPIGPEWLQETMADITALGGYSVLTLIIVFVAVYLLAVRKWHAAIITVFAVGSGSIMSWLLKLFFSRDRPDLVPHLVEATSASFPSGHAMLSAVTYLTLGTLLVASQERRRVKFLIMGYAILIALLVGISRVYLGVHWPTDVLAGWAFGSAWAALWWIIGWFIRGQMKR